MDHTVITIMLSSIFPLEGSRLVVQLSQLKGKNTYKAGVDSPGIEHCLVWLHTEHTWLGHSMFVLLDLRVDLVEGGVCGILTARYPDVDQPLLVEVVTKNVGWIRKQLGE